MLTTVVQSWLAHKSYLTNRNFQEKKEAYIGLITAYHTALSQGGDEKSRDCAYWEIRCSLVAPVNVREKIQLIFSDDIPAQKVLEELKEALRKDLGVQLTN